MLDFTLSGWCLFFFQHIQRGRKVDIIPKFVPIINKIYHIDTEMLVVCIAVGIQYPQLRIALGQWDCKISVGFG